MFWYIQFCININAQNQILHSRKEYFIHKMHFEIAFLLYIYFFIIIYSQYIFLSIFIEYRYNNVIFVQTIGKEVFIYKNHIRFSLVMFMQVSNIDTQ